jgi:multiple sugar transport system substrate-binding protein
MSHHPVLPVPLASMSRRRFLHTVGMAGGTALLSVAGLPSWSRAAKKEIRFLNNEPDPNTIAFLKKMVAEYEAASGVAIQLETIPVLETMTKVTTAIKAGKPYDFITFGQITDPLLLAKDDLLVPLTAIIKEVGLDDFGPRALDWYRNELWMYPYDYNFNYLIYRTDWFAAKNLQVPTDWQGFLRMLEVLNEPANKRYAYTMPVSSGGHTNWGNTAWLWAAGVQIYDDKWNVILDAPEIKPKAVRTLEFLTKAAQYTPPGLLEVSLKDMLTNFTASISAITSYTGRLIHHIEDRSPELADKYGIMAYPGPDGGKSMVTFANDGFSIGKTANTEEALKFFRWFVKNDKLTDYQLTVPLHYQPPQFSTYKNKRWRAHPLVEKHWAAMEVMLSFMNTDKTLSGSIQFQGPGPSPNQGRIWNSDVLPRMYQSVLTQKMSPGEAVDACAKEIREFTEKG